MALFLEGSRLVKWRLALSPSDFNRVSDLCTVLVLGMFIYHYASQRSPNAIVVLVQWLPLALLPLLMAQAEKVDKLQAICVVCGAPASRSQRLINGQPAFYDDPVIMVGAEEVYEARCRHCHQVPGVKAGG